MIMAKAGNIRVNTFLIYNNANSVIFPFSDLTISLSIEIKIATLNARSAPINL